MDERLFKKFESYLSQARVVLFTGAGFSLGAKNVAGVSVPSTGELLDRLWNIAFPGETSDGSGIQDVFEAAVIQARTDVKRVLAEQLTIEPSSLPEYYGRWFSMPWHRVYTLNIDNLEEATERAFALPRPIRPLSALTDAVPSGGDELQVIHLDGRLRDSPDVTFSGRQYAERLAQSDLWYANLAKELVSFPVLFVGTTLDEPPLWQYVEDRGLKVPGGRELRPGSFLVTRSLAKARAVALRRYQVDFIAGTAETFDREVLERASEAALKGLTALRQHARTSDAVLLHLDAVVDDSVDDEREYLRGREPRWADFLKGYAIQRNFDRDILRSVASDKPRMVVLTGTAGSGKSSSAMRLALALRADGRRVALLNRDADLRGYRLRRAIQHAEADVLLIDDLDQLGGRAVGLLEDAATDRPDLFVVAALRSPAYQRLGLPEYTKPHQDVLDVVVPNLTDDDIDGLLDTLDAANRLGDLKGKPRATQRQVMAAKCDRQLLVAMYEATSGEPFNAKIDSECRQLPPESMLIYAVVALATNFRVPLGVGDIQTAVGGDPARRLRTVDDLVRTHLLVQDKVGRVGLRHRVIAERAVEFFRSARQVETALSGLIFSLAATARQGELRSTARGRAVIRLINHKLLIEFLRAVDEDAPDKVGIRSIYQDIEGVLPHDHHFWLQRGSFETEIGDLDLAKNFLEQARGLAPEDPFVRTQWAYMTLKRASRHPDDPSAATAADAAFGELQDVIESRGKRDSYPYHVYGSQGLAWAKRARLTSNERQRLLLALRAVVDDGRKNHPVNAELRKLSRDLESEYLSLAV